MPEFVNQDLTGSEFRSCHFVDVTMRDIEFKRVTIRDSEVVDLDIHAEIGRLVVNGVDVGPLVEAELDRRYPDRPKMRPTTPDGFREAWDTVERLWDGTVERARRLDPALLHESVDGEWSFIETLRHLSFATGCWVRRAILGDPSPWDPLDLPWDGMADTPGVPRDRAARPTLDEALALRHSRMATVRDYVDRLTPAVLASGTQPVDGPGWPPARSFPVAECLRVVLNEEWEHRLYAERDLAVLESRSKSELA
jgi:DinB family protein